MDEFSISRRNVFVAGALGAVAVAGLTKTAGAEAKDDTHKANIKVVEDFIKAWDDPDKSVTYLADNASVRMVEDQPAIVGPAAVAAAFKGFMGPGVKLSVKILHTYAEGPLVTNKRVDTMTTPGKPAQAFPVVGVFIVKKGKIVEWTDWLDT